MDLEGGEEKKEEKRGGEWLPPTRRPISRRSPVPKKMVDFLPGKGKPRRKRM